MAQSLTQGSSPVARACPQAVLLCQSCCASAPSPQVVRWSINFCVDVAINSRQSCFPGTTVERSARPQRCKKINEVCYPGSNLCGDSVCSCKRTTFRTDGVVKCIQLLLWSTLACMHLRAKAQADVPYIYPSQLVTECSHKHMSS